MGISRELLEVIACPKCKGVLVYNESENILICEVCKVYYEVKEDIPILLAEEAKPLELNA